MPAIQLLRVVSWGLVMRSFGALFIIFAAMITGGCSNFFPSFSKTNLLAYPAHGEQIPLVEVENTLKCELSEFLRSGAGSTDPAFYLNPSGSATVELEVLVSSKGGVKYSTINVEKGDLLSLLLISKTDGIKAPIAEIAGTGFVTAKVSFTMSQEMPAEALKGCKDANDPLNRGSRAFANSGNPFSFGKLGVGEWLTEFFSNRQRKALVGGPKVELKDIKLETKFVFVASLDASVKRLIRIVPIDKFPEGTFKQDVTNRLSITFVGGKKPPAGPTLSECLLASSLKFKIPEACDKPLKPYKTAKRS